MTTEASQEKKRIYRVGELNRRISTHMKRWPDVWVEGEITDFSRARSGHLYFTLDDPDENAQLRVVMYKHDAARATAELKSGEQVQIFGRFSLYEPRGSFQFIARKANVAGAGKARLELLRLKKKLAAEGLFSPARKRPLPRFPQLIGVVTSRDAAALRDVMRVAANRAPVHLLLSHCKVQGVTAPSEIVQALQRLRGVEGLDVVIVTRGGGSADDLQAFNDEGVARAIADFPVPVVSGVGHEIDESISDLVADRRAATPSNAAELVVPEKRVLAETLANLERQSMKAFETRMGRLRLRLERVEKKLQDPRRHLEGQRSRFLAQSARIERAFLASIKRQRLRLRALENRLARLEPKALLARDRGRLLILQRALEQRMPARIREERQRHQALVTRLPIGVKGALRQTRTSFGERIQMLQALSPLAVMARGYAIALDAESGKAVIRAKDVDVDDALRVRLHEGQLRVRVEERLSDDDI